MIPMIILLFMKAIAVGIGNRHGIVTAIVLPDALTPVLSAILPIIIMTIIRAMMATTRGNRTEH
jgi:hypothetical protein